MNVKNEILVRVYVVLAIVVLLALLIFGQAIRIALFEKDKWKAKEEKIHYQEGVIKGDRGNILATDGSLLATSLPFYDIHFDATVSPLTNEIFNKHVDSLGYLIAKYIDNTYTPGGYADRLKDARRNGEKYILIKKNATYLEKEAMAKFPIFNRGRYRGGFIAQRNPKRRRPFGILAHRTVGYVRDGAKPVGLEGRFNDILSGTQGEELLKFRKIRGKNGQTILIPVDDYTLIKPKSGKDIQTTIDIGLQDIAQQALLRGVQHHDAEFGTAIVMEVETGAIRAIANVGRTSDGWWERFNYAVGTPVEPGSTFKMATVLALLDDGYITPEDTIALNKGRHEFYEEEMVDASYHALEETTLQKAFEISSNVGIALLTNEAYARDKKKFYKKMKSFHLDAPTGIEIDGEIAPYIKDPENKDDDWSGTTLPWMSIGYELTITPLQLLSFYNAVANDGKMMKPYLVSDILEYGKAVKTFKPVIIDQNIAKKSAIRQVKQLLEGVVENGTAKAVNTDKYNFAGKTGTAQLNYNKIRKSGKLKYQASFAGYFPAENPKYSVMVLVNDPKQHGFYGSEVAAPIFREIADKTFASKIEMQQALNEEPASAWRTYKLPDQNVGQTREITALLDDLNFQYTHHAANAEWGIIRAKSDTLSVHSKPAGTEKVPNVLGMGIKDAMYLLENAGMKVTISGIGKIRKQSVPPGRKINGQTIHLTLG